MNESAIYVAWVKEGLPAHQADVPTRQLANFQGALSVSILETDGLIRA
jgi:hypothetical protein